MNDKKIERIKKLVKTECSQLKQAPEWFFKFHLLSVEKFAKKLLKKLPDVNEEIVMLCVWLHDIQRVRGLEGEHAATGAEEAAKILAEFGYDKEIIEPVTVAIRAHSCEPGLKPKTIEGKILTTADAMAHYHNDFYIRIAATGQRDAEEFKEWALKKLERDYNQKISFDFIREEIQERHDAIKKFIKLG